MGTAFSSSKLFRPAPSAPFMRDDYRDRGEVDWKPKSRGANWFCKALRCFTGLRASPGHSRRGVELSSAAARGILRLGAHHGSRKPC